ncbi:uncharacterized protein LOC132153932 [Carassius carassius]|uniref:uncharacterized protein LOC132153932 n=1 Tax=Carassius carassius TaxID=217509 RepID=UPI002868DAAB|nr:uncharacterized protein LOC132153932 [Carassius carassius]
MLCKVVVKYEGPVSSTPMKKRPVLIDLTITSIGSSDSDKDKHTSEKASKGSAGVEELARLECSLSEMSIGAEEHLDEQAINDLRNSTIDWAVNPPPVKASDTDDEEQDSSDEELAGALPNVPNFDALPVIGLEETVHDLTADFESEPSTDPDSSTASPADSNVPTVQKAEDIVGAKASIVYDDCLKYLAAFVTAPVKRCTAINVTGATCQHHPPFLVNIKGKGTASMLEWSCADGHIVWRWVSQPLMKYGLQAGDFMLSTSILLSGNNYAKIALLFRFMNMGLFGQNYFFSIQDAYCVDSIKKYWMEKRADVIARLQDKDVVVLADGRNDTPGHCALYCSYTTMENDTLEIISVVTVDKRQTDRRSAMMEKEAFILTIDQLVTEVKLVEICTDAHSQIGALMDPYKAAQVKELSVLLLLLKDIVNHFWWCCKTADSYEEFLTLWAGLLHHVCNELEWAMGSCKHGQLADSEKQWIQRDSKAHNALVEIILKKGWLKDVHKYLRFRSTADLESYQNHILMYASKRFAFSPPVYEARVLLAALDYNYHRDRPTQKRADGTEMYRRVYKKNAKQYSVYARKTPKSYSYIGELQTLVVRCRLESGSAMPRTRTLRPDDPRRLGLLPPVPPPPTAELVQRQVRRGLGPDLQSS